MPAPLFLSRHAYNHTLTNPTNAYFTVLFTTAYHLYTTKPPFTIMNGGLQARLGLFRILLAYVLLYHNITLKSQIQDIFINSHKKTPLSLENDVLICIVLLLFLALFNGFRLCIHLFFERCACLEFYLNDSSTP